MAAARWSPRAPRSAARALAPKQMAGVAQQRCFRRRAWGEVPKTSEDNDGGVYNPREIEKYQAYLNGLEDQNGARLHRARAEAWQSQQQPEHRQQSAARAPAPAPDPTSPGRNTQLAAALAQSDGSDLVAPVRIPDDPDGVLPPHHPASSILGTSSVVIQRQIELMNLVVGFEQANRYIIMDGRGQTIGYIAEQDHGLGRAMARQLARTHRSFTTYIFDRHEREVLRIHRPFAWINSTIRIYDALPDGGYGDGATATDVPGVSADSAVHPPRQAQVSPLPLEEMRIVGEAQQQWAPLRRKYNLFSYRPLAPARHDATPRLASGGPAAPPSDTHALAGTESASDETAIEAGMAQFAQVNEPFLSWDFTLRDESHRVIGSVNRTFGGLARELLTDTGVYALRMDSAAQDRSRETAAREDAAARHERDRAAMTLDQRAVMLATAVSIDFDYFSRHSRSGSSGFLPFVWPMGGGAAGAGEAGAAAGGVAGEAGAMEGASGAAGAVGRPAVGESAAAGAGTMAGYEAMQRGAYASRGDDASAHVNEPFSAHGQYPEPGGDSGQQGGDEVWSEGDDPWDGGGGTGGGPPPPPRAEGGGEDAEGGGGGGGGGGGLLDSISSFFDD